MKKKFLKKGIALGLTLTMLGAMAGCGNSTTGGQPESSATAGSQTKESVTEGSSSEASSQAASSESKDVTTITLYPENASLQSGLVGGYKADIFADYGFAVDVWAYSDEKTNAILASGSLPDVMYVSRENFEVMIESGMVLNLEDYLDQLPNITENSTVELALDYMREYNSAGTGELYGIPTGVGEKVVEYNITKNMTTINWKYYEGIGAPEINDQWELLDVMKQMVEAYPTGDDGVVNYGTYLNSGSDTEYWAGMTMYYKWFGYEPNNLYYLLEMNMVDGESSSILSEDSIYYEGLKWYNTAYREGLLDPDSINTDRATQKAKVDSGHAMVSSGTLQGTDAGGFQAIYIPGQELYQESVNSVYGRDWVLVVNAKSKNIDAALSFINMMADSDAYLQVKSGPEGELWYVEDGVAYVKDETVENWGEITLTKFPLSTGETAEFWNTVWVIDDASFKTSYVDEEGNPRPIRIDRWAEVQEAIFSTERMTQWREMTGYEFWVDQATDNDAFNLTSDLDYVANFVSLPDDTMKLTLDAIKDVVVNASWQMVYANTDEEFNSIWEQMVNDCNDLGAEDVIEWRLNDLEQAVEKRDALSNQ